MDIDPADLDDYLIKIAAYQDDCDHLYNIRGFCQLCGRSL